MSVMNVSANNPAGRLYLLLDKAKKLKGTGIGIWREVFEIPAEDDTDELELDIAFKLFETRRLVEDVESALQRIEDIDTQPYLGVLPEIRSALSLTNSRTTNYEVILERINVHAMGLLRLASEVLATRHVEPLISEADLSEILNDVRQIFEGVRASNIEDRLRSFILDCLMSIEKAIQNFRIRGPKYLEDALVLIAGELTYRYGDIPEIVLHDETSKHWFDRLKNVLGRVDSLVRFTDRGMKILERGSRILALLGPGDNIPPVK